MTPEIFKYLVVSVFVILTFYLSWIGMRKTKDIKSFSIGNKDMNPYLIGITMAASISSTATFVINPGFVYAHGLSAYLHYGVAAPFGILCAFLLITKGFRQLGQDKGSLTIPDWIFHRYGSRALSVFFAIINLLSIAFVVLILVGSGMLMSNLFGITQFWGLTFTLLFVFSYVLMGGTYAHAYTNTFQGMMMVFISLFLFFHGFKYFDQGFFASLNQVGANYAGFFNPESNLYYDFFSVFGSGFIITFALMLQPHILTKVLYLRSDKDISKFIFSTIGIAFCFGLILFIGFYARLSGLVVEKQDAVVTQYIIQEFGQGGLGPYLLTFITITLLAAGMSTLDGILVALSSMVVKDLYLPFKGNSEQQQQKALAFSRYVLIAVGVFAYLIALNPPSFVGLFAQKGVYGLAAASFVPILFGVMIKKPIPTWIMGVAAAMGLIIHLVLNIFGGVTNPAVSSSYAIGSSTVFFLVANFLTSARKLEVVTESVKTAE